MTDFKIIEIKPFYIVNEDNVSKKYSTLIDIANDYKTNIDAKLEIEALQIQLSKIESEKLESIIVLLNEILQANKKS